jgi:hypothetical protein
MDELSAPTGSPGQDAVLPPDVVRADGQTQAGQAVDDLGEGDLQLHPGQLGADAVVDAVAEREVVGGTAPESFGLVRVSSGDAVQGQDVGGVEVGARRALARRRARPAPPFQR